MKKLTKREKVLIYMLVCFGLLMGGFYLVLIPSFEAYRALRVELSEAEFTQSSMETAIENMPAVLESQGEANVELAGLQAPFSKHLPNEGLDMLLTQLCLDYGLTPKVLGIASNEWAGVPTFTEAPLLYQTNSGMTAGGTSQNTTETPTGTAPEIIPEEITDIAGETSPETTSEIPAGNPGSTPTWTGMVSMDLTGTQYDFQRLTDAVNARPDMIISSFEITPVAETTDGTSTSGNSTTTTSSSGWAPELNGGNVTIKVMFSVYMVDK